MISLNNINLGKEEINNITHAISKGELSGLYGSYVKEFEKRVALYCDKRYGVATTNCTSAIHLALLSLGIGKKDKVVVPSYTNIGTLLGVLYTGATPVFVDCDSSKLTVPHYLIKNKIYDKKVKAVIVVHMYGNPTELFSDGYYLDYKREIPIIEDCAEAMGAFDDYGKLVGSYGKISCHSFYATKMITTGGEGGMAITDKKVLADKMRYYSNMCYDKEERYKCNNVGYNYRMTNIQAAIGVAQMQKLTNNLTKKRQIHKLYKKLFKNIDGVRLQHHLDGSACWMNCIMVDDYSIRDKIREYLYIKGIQTGDVFTPLHMQPIVKTKDKCPNAESIYKKGFLLPSGIDLGNEQIWYIYDTLKEGIRRYGK